MINPEQLPLNLDLRRRAVWHRKLFAFCLTVPIVLLAGGFMFANAQTPPPVLVSEPTSTRAIALESLTFMPEPFALVSPDSWSGDSRTRIILFALNLSLQPGENLSSVTADAEDSTHRTYNFAVEYIGPVPEEPWLSAVVLKLSDDLGDVGDVLVRISHQGVRSNRVRVAIGHRGGGPPDDPGSAPTPAPPYFISGQVMNGGTGFSGVTVKLTGPQTDTFVTDASGAYQFTVLTAGIGYTVTASKSYYDFSPSSQTFAIPGNNQTNINFTATRQSYTIGGHVLDETGQGVDSIQLSITNEAGATLGTSLTVNGGNYSFANLPAGFGYTVTAGNNSFFTFTPLGTSLLTGNLTLDFTGVRRLYAISGRTIDGTGSGIGGVTVNLSGSRSASTTTNTSGAFTFTGLPAGGNYSVTPPTTPFYTFTSQSFSNLISNQSASLTGTLRHYSITGRVTEGANGMAGVNVVLSGASQATVTTDSNGNYSFTNLTAARTYTVTPSIAHYVFTPANLVLNKLGSDVNAGFDGLFRYFISGRFLNNANQGVPGITVTMSGSLSGSTFTAGDGSYSLPVAPLGNYTLTPSIEQDWYSFSPTTQSLNSVNTDQTINFTATMAPIPNPPYVLEFDATPKTVAYGYFWREDVDLGHFFWEFWAMPGNNAGARYMLTDGYGGAHALLFGFGNYGASEPGRYRLFGNIFDGMNSTSFTSDQGPAAGEWGHFAIGWDGQNLITYFDGVPVGKTTFTGPRRTPGPGGGGSQLLIGGSDHNNFDGRIAQVRGYEGSNPREDLTGSNNGQAESSFTPQTVFAADGNLLSYYFRPAPRVADLSMGHDGRSHPGVLLGTLYGMLSSCPGCPLPNYVIDPTAPNFATGAASSPVLVNNPAPAPGGARIFDSFSRANSTYLFNGNGGLGATESGTAGAKNWQTNQSSKQPFGILNGRAVLLANDTYITWIPTGSSSANLDVRVDRHAGGAGSGLDTGISFRVLGGGNFFFAYTSVNSDPSGPRRLTVGYYLDGQRVNLMTGVNMPANWTTLRVVTKSSGEITVYADATQVYATTNNTLSNATGAGLYNNSSGLGLVNRWDNFVVYDVP